MMHRSARKFPTQRIDDGRCANRASVVRALGAALAIVIALTGHALAWGGEGHRLVAEIAEQYLEPETARQVRELLALENATTLAEVSTWADEIRGQWRDTARWHYVNIPIHQPAGTPTGYDAARDCPKGDCVVAKIDEFAAVLRDKREPARDRLEALKFVVHFVADVHQPLHAANDDDRGGNDVKVTFLGRQTNLHAVWDTGILFAAGIGDERAYALQLARSIKPADLLQWRVGSAATWATESYDVARRLIYGEWPHGPDALRASYEDLALPVVSVQIEKAGVRLAAVLNAALR
jgi:nuclease S1